MIYLYFGIIIFVVEIVLAFLFSAVTQVLYKKMGLNFRSIIKGLLERCFLFVALMNDYPHSLTLFGALKVATRLKHDDKDAEAASSFSDFYLIGNFISASVAIGYVYLFKTMMSS
jgi:hypothetical protein